MIALKQVKTWRTIIFYHEKLNIKIKMKHLLLVGLFGLCFGNQLTAQNTTGMDKVSIDGQLLTYMVDDCGDTILVANLDDVSITSPRKFENREDLLTYRRYRRYAIKVYPYAVEAIKIFRELDYATETLSKRKRKKYVKKLQKDLEREFEEPLKKLSKTQGKILFKMIEKELDTPMHDLIKNLRGGFTATYWSTFASMWGHKLKEGYIPGDDPIMDIVLNDMDISHKL